MEVELSRLLWCLLPEFDIQFARPRGSRRMRARVASALVPGALRPFTCSVTEPYDDGLIVTRSANERRALYPVAGLPLQQSPRNQVSLPGRASREPVTRRAKEWIDDRLRRANRPELRATWHHAADYTQHQIRRNEHLDLTRYRFILIARQTHPLLRALILTAEAQHVPVVYVPHSPLTSFQVDLPVSYAALRGDAEREWIAAETDADTERIAVVGNPATNITRLTANAGANRLPGVFAVSPDPEPALRRMVALLRDAGLREVLVAPHPRSDLTMLERMLPAGWTLNRSGLTVDLLRQGPPWLIHSSSGVAWESAVLGIPTADIRLDDRAPDYPLLQDADTFAVLRTPEDVRRFVRGAAVVDRERLRAHARRWCATDGAESVRRVRELLERIDGPQSRIVDAWTPDGVLHHRSALTAG